MYIYNLNPSNINHILGLFSVCCGPVSQSCLCLRSEGTHYIILSTIVQSSCIFLSCRYVSAYSIFITRSNLLHILIVTVRSIDHSVLFLSMGDYIAPSFFSFLILANWTWWLKESDQSLENFIYWKATMQVKERIQIKRSCPPSRGQKDTPILQRFAHNYTHSHEVPVSTTPFRRHKDGRP